MNNRTEATDVEAKPASTSREGGRPSTLKILVVEDDFVSRFVLQKLLSSYGECHVAVNGREAVQACEVALEDGTPYQLVCLDIMMPTLDGHGALHEIRLNENRRGILSTCGTKIAMVTALSDMKNVMGAYRGLCDGYLTKPINRASIKTLLQQLELI